MVAKCISKVKCDSIEIGNTLVLWGGKRKKVKDKIMDSLTNEWMFQIKDNKYVYRYEIKHVIKT